MEEYRRRMQERHQKRGGVPAPVVAQPPVAPSAPPAPAFSSLNIGDPRRDVQRPLLGVPPQDGWLPKVSDTCCGIEVQTLVLMSAGVMAGMIFVLLLSQLVS